MNSKGVLTDNDRDFFDLVTSAILANPFSESRDKLDKKMASYYEGEPVSGVVNKAILAVDQKIRQLKEKNRANLIYFSGHDRELIANAFIFMFFYSFKDKFDQFIIDQTRAGDEPITLSFADEALEYFRSRGFETKTALRHIALAYQFRRAFYFIGYSLIGQSPVMKQLRNDLWNNIFTHNVRLYEKYLWNRMENFSTLLLGETGTGKGTAAMAIGRSGFIPFDIKKKTFVESFTRSFISLNLSQFPESLLESELFGHKKGAFTGAVEDHKGIFEKCSPFGSILLDEIGEVSIPVQIKLLQVLQDRVFSPVGSHTKSRFEGRVIAATNRNIHEIQHEKIFRDDFYYRLCSEVITVPRLQLRIQETPAELDMLLEYLIEKMLGSKSNEVIEMVRDVVFTKLGKNYAWPGNVRELEQCIRSVIINSSYEGVSRKRADNIHYFLTEGIGRGDLDAQSLLSGYCYMLYNNLGTYEEVARRTSLDRRTVKKHIVEWEKRLGNP
ncbi:MAG: sigma-54-dependent Fis family transcriptional regulator [Desulfobacterales bacterium]|nr:sigma-54-dependent Fis family transcriptional regulator [Desulfobacterales bacterium]